MLTMLMHAGVHGHLHPEDFLIVAIVGALAVLSIAASVRAQRREDRRKLARHPNEVQ